MRRPRTTKVVASRSVSTAGATSGSKRKDKDQPRISFGSTGAIDYGVDKPKKPATKKSKR
ncbi:hypothetical protein WYO_0195 [Methylobacterium sp. GXF4]|nr:hypothetical protein WYO_0195 [Methylobacterium sp. GXF4]